MAPLSPAQRMPDTACMTWSLLPSWGGRLCQFKTTSDSGSASGSERNRIDSMKLYIKATGTVQPLRKPGAGIAEAPLNAPRSAYALSV
jgi:hypothetical protein